MGSQPVGLSGSRAAAILGLSDYATPLQVWQLLMEERRPGFNARRGYTMPPPVDNAAVRWGNAFESAVVQLASEYRGQPIHDRESLYVHGDPSSPYRVGIPDMESDDLLITAHVDGIYECGDLHEGKTTTAWTYAESWGEPGSDRIPQAYQLQCAHQMLCTGAERASVSVLVFPKRPDDWEAAGVRVERRPGRSDDMEWHVIVEREGRVPYVRTCMEWARLLEEMGYFAVYHLEARPALQSALLAQYAEWWERYVIGEREPEPRDWDDIRRLVPAPKGTVVVTEQEARWLAEHREIKAEIGGTGRLAKRCEELRVLVMNSVRQREHEIDDESRERTVFRDAQGNKLGQFSPKGFRT